MGFIQHYSLTSLWVVAFIAVLTIGPTSGAQCRKMDPVRDSMSSLDRNSALGGHVWIHVYGEKDRPSDKKPAIDKSMFAKAQDLGKLWDLWKEMGGKTNAKCSLTKNSYHDCVPIEKLASAGVTHFKKCKTVAGNECKELYKQQRIVAVRFDYVFKKPGGKKAKAKSKGQWIVNTAFPADNKQCLM